MRHVLERSVLVLLLAGSVLACSVQPGQAGTPTCPEGAECQELSREATPKPDPLGTEKTESEASGVNIAALRPGTRPWRRGGGGSAGPLRVAGPEARPKLLWRVSLGAAITGTPTFAALGDGATAAFVGTHAGRFAGLRVDGPRGGEIAVDLSVPGIIWGSAGLGERGGLVVGADNDTLYGVDPVAGSIAWSRRIGACDPPRARGPVGTRCDPDGGPTIGANGDIYIGADGLYRLGPEGELRWHYPQESEFPWHVAAAPLVTPSGEVFVGGQDGALVALDRDGGLRWRHELGPDVDGAPVLLGNGWLIAAADGGLVVALDQRGELRWTFTAGGDIRAPLAIAADDTIYAAALDGQLYALRPGGELRWSFAAGAALASAPVVDSVGRIYFGTRDGAVIALDRRGRERWRIDLPEDVDSGPAISESGVLVVGCDDGVVRAYQ